MTPASQEKLEVYEAILQDLYDGNVSVQNTAEKLETMTLNTWESDLEANLRYVWSVLQGEALESSDHHEILAELLVTMANLPPVLDDEGNQIKLYITQRVWGELSTKLSCNQDT